MVLHNPGNWHWVDKNCIPWSKEYFQEKLLLSAEQGDTKVAITKLASLEGDCDVCQRKGKVIGLYDMQLTLELQGKAGESDVKGKVQIPEVMYNTEEDEYVFNISIENESKETDPVKQLVRKEIIPRLRKAFVQYSTDLIKENGTTIQHPDQNAKAPTTVQQFERPKTEQKVTNTTSVKLSPTFTASAEQLYQALTEPQMVAAWSRSPPNVDPKVGGKFSLFGDNVTGEFLQLDKPNKITQSWRLKDWKQGHYSQVVFSLTQDVGVTTLDVEWTGIPIGQEDVVSNNFKNYYVHPIMLTFGFGVPS